MKINGQSIWHEVKPSKKNGHPYSIMPPLIKQAMTAESAPAIEGKEAEKRLQEGAEENAARSGGKCSGARRRVEGRAETESLSCWRLGSLHVMNARKFPL